MYSTVNHMPRDEFRLEIIIRDAIGVSAKGGEVKIEVVGRP